MAAQHVVVVVLSLLAGSILAFSFLIPDSDVHGNKLSLPDGYYLSLSFSFVSLVCPLASPRTPCVTRIVNKYSFAKIGL